MPLPKRLVEPIHVARGTIPEDFPLPSELEAATNGTLANAVRQLSSLSKHAEDLFGELTRDAHVLATRANNLQARIDRLAIKVTQLDSNVEEVSLQDIHMRKAFKSSVVFDQKVVSRDTMPTAMLETYKLCDRPPPLDKLNPYREDGKDGLKFYTDPDYFFDLWRQEMLKDTERMMHDRGKKPHRPRGTEGGGGRHKKRVRQPHNTRERQRQIAVGHGEYIMPQTIPYRTPQQQQLYSGPEEQIMGVIMNDPTRPSRPNSIELRRSYPEQVDGGIYSPRNVHSPTEMHYRANYPMGYDESAVYSNQQSGYNTLQGGVVTYTSPNGTPSRSSRALPPSQRPSHPPPAPPSNNNSATSTPTVSSATNTPTRGRSMSAGREQLPPPPPPPVETPPPMMTSPPAAQTTPPRNSVTPEPLPPPPPIPEPPRPTSPTAAANIPPPPPPPPPPPISNGPVKPASPPLLNGDIVKSPVKQIISTSPPKSKQIDNVNMNATTVVSAPTPRNKAANPAVQQYDPRSDLLKAIRDGIKLRKVEKIEQKEGERQNAFHDVASILARRVAVEFSDSDSASESEYDSEGWCEQETSA